MRLSDRRLIAQGDAATLAVAQAVVRLVEAEGAGYDFGSYRGVTPGFRIWTGTTVAASEIRALLPWLEWAYATATAQNAT